MLDELCAEGKRQAPRREHHEVGRHRSHLLEKALDLPERDHRGVLEKGEQEPVRGPHEDPFGAGLDGIEPLAHRLREASDQLSEPRGHGPGTGAPR